jgi:hypothetical protein
LLNLSFGLYKESIFFSIVYFAYCIISIFGFGLFFKKFYKEYFYAPFYGLSLLIALGPLFFSAITYNLLLYIIFPLGFLFAVSNLFLLKIKSFLFKNSFFLFLIFFYFFFAFYQFVHNYDDLAGYFPVIESFKNKRFSFEGFDVRNFFSYPSVFFVTSIFQQNGNLYQARFVDIFFGILLSLIFFNSFLKKKTLIEKYKNFILFFIPIFIFSVSTTITPHMIAIPYLFIVLYELRIIYQKTSSKINIFNFFFFSGVCIAISFKFIPFVFFIIVSYFLFCLKRSLLLQFFLYSPFFFLSILCWFFYSYLNFDTPISLLRHGISFYSYSNYQELYRQVSFTEQNIFNILFEKIKILLFSGYEVFYIFYQFTYHHSLFLIILGFYFFSITKNFFFILILSLYTLSICSLFLSDQAVALYYFRYIYPITIAVSLFFLYEYLTNYKQNRSSKNFFIIFLLFFLIFEKIDYSKHFRNYLHILGIDTRFYKKNTHNFPYYHRLGLLQGLYDPELINDLNNITIDLSNKRILTYINEPYLLNFKKNSIFFIDFYMFYTSPHPGYPFDSGFNEKLYYFKNLNIDYILVDINIINHYHQNKRENYSNIFEPQEGLFNFLNKNFSNFILESLESLHFKKINQYILIKL